MSAINDTGCTPAAAAALDRTQISLSGLVDVIRLLLDEQHELLKEKQ